eukprot:scaffold4944_cov135-Isochrysis_galbana.AAC.1
MGVRHLPSGQPLPPASRTVARHAEPHLAVDARLNRSQHSIERPLLPHGISNGRRGSNDAVSRLNAGERGIAAVVHENNHHTVAIALLQLEPEGTSHRAAQLTESCDVRCDASKTKKLRAADAVARPPCVAPSPEVPWPRVFGKLLGTRFVFIPLRRGWRDGETRKNL